MGRCCQRVSAVLPSDSERVCTCHGGRGGWRVWTRKKGRARGRRSMAWHAALSAHRAPSALLDLLVLSVACATLPFPPDRRALVLLPLSVPSSHSSSPPGVDEGSRRPAGQGKRLLGAAQRPHSRRPGPAGARNLERSRRRDRSSRPWCGLRGRPPCRPAQGSQSPSHLTLSTEPAPYEVGGRVALLAVRPRGQACRRAPLYASLAPPAPIMRSGMIHERVE